MPVIPATKEAEAVELPEPGGRGCGEPGLCHCTLAWVTRVKLHLKKKKEPYTRQSGQAQLVRHRRLGWLSGHQNCLPSSGLCTGALGV